MKTVAEYRRYADKCRKFAAKSDRPEDKQALETIARASVQVANEREAVLFSTYSASIFIRVTLRHINALAQCHKVSICFFVCLLVQCGKCRELLAK